MTSHFSHFSGTKKFPLVITDNRIKFDPDPERRSRFPKECIVCRGYLPSPSSHFYIK